MRNGESDRGGYGHGGGAACRARRLPAAMAFALCLAALSSCVTTGDKARGSLPAPLTAIGLGVHNANIALGAYRRKAEAGQAHMLSPAEARAGLSKAGSTDRVTWLGHSSVLLRIAGSNVLLDPVFPEFFSLSSPLPHLHVPLPLAFADLPSIDVVVISHGDFDHLHMPSLRAVAKRDPDALMVVPAGLEHHARKAGFRRIANPVEGAAFHHRGLTFTAFPARHHTRRNLLALPDGPANIWEIRAGTRKVVFIGDGAYDPALEEFARRRGPYDLALLPIGAYEPGDLVGEMHATPEETARIVRLLRARRAIGIHWGTFALSPEPLRAPAERYLAAMKGNPAAMILRLGETTKWR